MSDNPIVNIEKTVALREAEMTTNSAISDLKRRVARAVDESWLAAVQECHREGREVYPRDIIREHILPAALKAHAEWLEEQGLVVRPKVMTPAVAENLLSKAWEAKISAALPVNSPFERVPVCACDKGTGEPPPQLQILECKMRGGPCAQQEEQHHD